MTDLVLVPAACYPVYPAIAARGPLRRGGLTVDAGGSLRLPPRALRRPGAPADVPPARDRPHRRARGGRRLARRVARPRRSSCCARLGLDGRLRRRHPTRSSAAAAGCSRASQREQELKFEIAGPDRRPGADRGRLLQLPPGSLRRRSSGSSSPTAARAHRLPRLRPRAHHAGAAAHARPRPRRRGRTRCARSSGCDEHRDDRDGQPARARPGDLRAAPAARAGPRLPRDELLHGHPGSSCSTRAATSRWRCSAFTVARSTSRATSGRSSSRRPEDLERLYGIDIHEMQPYRSLPEQIAEQIAAGRTIIVELDSWYLPDTAATATATSTSRPR